MSGVQRLLRKAMTEKMDRSDSRPSKPGISGASGVVYGVRTLEALRALGVETHLVMTRAAQVTLAHETTMKVADVEQKVKAAARYARDAQNKLEASRVQLVSEMTPSGVERSGFEIVTTETNRPIVTESIIAAMGTVLDLFHPRSTGARG